MNTYQVLVCREVWGTIAVQASSAEEAIEKATDYDYDSDFEPNGKVGNESFYGTMLIEEGEE